MTAEERRLNLFHHLLKQKTLKVPPDYKKTFQKVYKNKYGHFKLACWGNNENTKNCFEWLLQSENDNGKPIIPTSTTLQKFYQEFLCEDVPYAQQNKFCKTTSSSLDWSSGKVVADKEGWFKKFPCLRRPFDGKIFDIGADDNGYTYFINVNPKNNVKYRFYSDGDIYSEDGEKDMGRKWACKEGKGSGGVVFNESRVIVTKSVINEQIEMTWDNSSPTTTNQNTTNQNTTNQNTTNQNTNVGFTWNEHCEGTDANPYKVGCKSANIGKAQGCLGSLYTGIVDDKFGKLTLSAIKQKLGKDTFTNEDLNRKICEIKFDDSDDSSLDNISDLP